MPAAAVPAPAAAPAPAPAAPAPGANPQNPFAALAQLGQALSGGQPGAAGGQVVNWKSLEPFVPAKLGAWDSDGDLRGSTGGLGGMQVSTVKRRYKQGDRSLSVEIVDTTMSPFMRTGIRMAMGFAVDGSDGVKKGVKVGGFDALLDWNKGSQRGKVAVLVGERFLVNVTLRPSPGAEDVVAQAALVNLAGLAGVK
jgi:hypothetical protein